MAKGLQPRPTGAGSPKKTAFVTFQRLASEEYRVMKTCSYIDTNAKSEKHSFKEEKRKDVRTPNHLKDAYRGFEERHSVLGQSDACNTDQSLETITESF
jgi:hypothetical protein